MKEKSVLLSIVSYITWIGWIAALVLRDKGDALVRRHLNQALILNLIATAGTIVSRLGGLFAAVGSAVGVLCLVMAIWGIIRAAQANASPLPVIGEITLIQ